MAMTSCRECGQPVSTEASACPHCGVGSPTAAPSSTVVPSAPAPARSSRSTVVWLVGGGVVAVLVGGYFLGKSQGWFPAGSIDSEQVASVIAARYTQISGHPVEVTCPPIPQQKGKISDCTATRPDTGQSTQVFVTQIDTAGHFTYQPADASVLVAAGLLPSEPVASAAPELSAEDAAKQNDKGWVLESFAAQGSGGTAMTARIKNANAGTCTAFFTMTLMQGGTVLATWHGSADSVGSGQTVSVTLLSADTLHQGVKADAFQFQTDTSIPTGP